MIQTIDLHTFAQAFRAHNRENQFSHEALRVIFDHYEGYEQDTGEQVELDVIATCCEITEASTATIAADYSINIEGMDEDEANETVYDYLQENTYLIGETSIGFVYLNF